ncbi:MAG: hypothetical protein ACREVK_10800 [Gammaproteobacteria bacterium]
MLRSLFFFVAGFVSRPHGIQQAGGAAFWNEGNSILLFYGLVLTALNSLMREGRLSINILLVILLVKLWLTRCDPLAWNDLSLALLATVLLLGNELFSNNVEYGLLGLSYALSGRLLAGGRRRFAALLLAATVMVQFGHYFSFKENRALLLSTALFLWAAFCFFRLRDISLPVWFKNPLLACSRYSLEIYFFHLAALKLYYIHSVVPAGAYAGFRF